jgi:hypothetical protein
MVRNLPQWFPLMPLRSERARAKGISRAPNPIQQNFLNAWTDPFSRPLKEQLTLANYVPENPDAHADLVRYPKGIRTGGMQRPGRGEIFIGKVSNGRNPPGLLKRPAPDVEKR